MSGQNQLDTQGLHIKTVNDIIDELTIGMQNIYGSDINVDASSPDGQLINIFAQAVADMLELLVSTYNSFNPESAYGSILDQRAALNGIVRQGATYTYVDVSITVTQGLNLQGLDGDPDASAFTVSDDAGNEFVLVDSYTFSVAGTASLSFRAKDIGAVLVTTNTITNQVTVVLGVSAVNNSAVATIQGVDGESDTDFKIRRLKSFMLSGLGWRESLEASILAVDSVTDVMVIENNTTGTVGGVPAHSIWIIVENGSEQYISEVIYEKRPLGCGMLGSVEFIVTRTNAQSFTAKFDRPLYTELYISFSISLKGGGTPDTAYIKTQLALALANYYKLNQTAIASELVSYILAIEPNAIITSLEVSDDDVTYAETVATTSAQYKFTVDETNITIS